MRGHPRKSKVNSSIALTKNGGLDLTADETTWGHQGYGEAGAGVVSRVVGKPGVTKGGQTFIVSSSDRVRPYFYQHRHNFTPKWKREGFNAQGPCEICSTINNLEHCIQGRAPESTKKKIFKEPPHITADNYFSGKKITEYAGTKGFGLLTTLRRDRLSKGIPDRFFHKGKTETNQRTKAARHVHPVVAVKTVRKGRKDFEVVIVSFQSTSSTKFMSMNSLSTCKNFIESRQRGRGEKKRWYVIKQNMGRVIYLLTYSCIDSIDHLIKNARFFYWSWKYWHSPTNHAKALAIVAAYDMYLECAEGVLDPEWKLEKCQIVSFHKYRDRLSKQMCTYDPRSEKYPGDEKMRVVTQLNKKRRVSCEMRSSSDGSGHVTLLQYRQAVRSKRICRDLEQYNKHVLTLVSKKYASQCAVCKERTFKYCGTCGVPLHCNEVRGVGKGKHCFLHWHSPEYFGICYKDRFLTGHTSTNWTPWTNRQLKENKRVINRYKNK